MGGGARERDHRWGRRRRVRGASPGRGGRRRGGTVRGPTTRRRCHRPPAASPSPSGGRPPHKSGTGLGACGPPLQVAQGLNRLIGCDGDMKKKEVCLIATSRAECKWDHWRNILTTKRGTSPLPLQTASLPASFGYETPGATARARPMVYGPLRGAKERRTRRREELS